ncbi:MAG: hypothetical protein FJ146_16565 [Deltaproteobacteria bacterium]|nr:hypothetical protein [Deltaproteobacteria bacterium]
MISLSKKNVLLSFMTSMLWACSAAEDSFVFSAPGASESKPIAAHAPLLARNSLNAASQPASKVASAKYLINVISNSGNEVCNGKASIEVMSDFTMTFPEAKIKCLSLTVNLAGILAAGAGSTPTGLSNLQSDGSILSIGEVANATFAPARPMLLGPVVQDPSIYKDFRKSVNTTVTVKEPGSKLDKKSAPGQFDIEVVPGPSDVLTTYANKLSPENNFDKVLHWTIAAKGFDGIPAKNGLLLKKMEWFWNIEPIMIPKVVITGELAGFIDTNGTPSSVNQLIGDIKITVTLQSWST